MSASRFLLPLLLLVLVLVASGASAPCSIDDDCHHDYSHCNLTTYECQCNEGYVPYEQRCVATGACNPDPCEANITYCYELPPTELQPNVYQCILYGFRPGTCSLMKALSCHELADCIDGEYDNSFSCRCQGDATGDGFNLELGTGCTTEYTPCSVDAECPYYGFCNLETYKCECKPGFEEVDKDCVDIKDCPSPECDPHANCTDFPGGFSCVCDGVNNYQGDGYTCTLVCLSDNNCHPKAKCNADQRCECNPGYEGDGEDCLDIDECADPATTNCHEHAICNNTQGSYECVCDNGYAGNGVECTALPRNCVEIPGFTSGAPYVIDPDFTGPANSFTVYCDTIRGVIVTKVIPLGVFPLEAPDTSDPGSVPVDYEPTPEDLHPLLNDSTFCYQDISFACWSGFALFPGTVWYDAFGQAHDNWGSTTSQNCACGVLSQCDNCECNGSQKKPTFDSGRIVDKNTLPVIRIDFAQLQKQKGSIDLGPLVCAPKQTNIPKDCHEAKFTYNIVENAVMYIDVDGPGGEEPFLVFCDMESFKHVGITELPPDEPTVVPTTEEGVTITYPSELTKLKALISGSVFCSQKIEFTCKNSRLLGDGGYVYGPTRKLDYFPGADGNQGLCGCGATQSCEQKEVKCNCDIQDGQERSDFGLIIDKSDLPAVKVTAEIGDYRSGMYTIGPLRCSQKQFGIEPNCEKYRGTGITEDYSYFIDPDGPGNLDPFLVECDFQESPPLGVTIVHHEEESTRNITDALWLIHYLLASDDQINGLTDRSTFCTQDVTLGCNQFDVSLPAGTINFQGALDEAIELGKYLQTCGADGQACACTGNGQQTDKGPIIDLDVLPVNSLDFANVISQLTKPGSSLAITLGPLVCYETFPTCAELKKFIDGGQSVEGEAAVINGHFTIDPDGPGGVLPFEVSCQFPSTIVNLGPPIDDVTSNPGDGPIDTCFDINYLTDTGDSISPEQITALVQKSDNCKQTLTLECENAPATGHVNFSSCDGTTQPGWAGSYGEDKCACGVNGNCDGGPQDNCNCDVADGETRSDTGTILNTDRLPVCQVCFSIDAPQPGPNGEAPPTKLLRYKLGKLTCDGNSGVRGTCQDARRVLGGSIKQETESSTALNSRNPIPVGCRFYPDPPIGALIVKAKEPVYPPEGNDTDITVIYITINIDLLFKEIKRNEYCTQIIYLFCPGPQAVTLTGDNAWYSYKGEASQSWMQLPYNHESVLEACDAHKELCQSCGLPLAFKLDNKQDLPLSRLVLARTGITVVVGEVSCFNLKASCQDISLSRSNRWTGFLGGRRYAIDPDGPGDIEPFSVNCDLDFPKKNGVTEVTVDGAWVGSVTFTGKDEPLEFYLPVEYPLASPEQIDALTKISNFCWQNVRYECTASPLLGNGNPSSLYSTFNGGNSSSFGTAEDSDFPGCACAVLGSCISGSSCNCDAKGSMGTVDQGAVTNKDDLPITGVYIGGQTDAGSSADVTVTNIRCASKPTDPPLDCADALERATRYGVRYDVSSAYLISPDPDDADLTPFLVYCDFDTFPGVGVTVIKPNYPEGNNQTHPPGEETTEEIPYYGPDKDQISAVIARSAYCYQGVRYDCYGSQLFAGGNYWLTTGDQAGTRNTFWGGGAPDPNDPRGFCACGVTNNCGGLDGSTQQMRRRCNCDAGDNMGRADAGIINLKEYLPIGSFVFNAETQFNSAALTVGDLYCSQEPLKFNECELGFHDCHHLATCKDLDEGYACICPPGWEGKAAVRNPSAPRANGRECIDDDECSWQPCPYSATCHNLPGSFNCTCNEGYTPVSPLECADINECLDPALNNCHENARCENLDGTYRCRCKRGYRGDGQTCIPVGVCSCFGDPHCQSYDNRFLHFQGLCEYVMSQDGCNAGETPTFRVLVEHWRQGNLRQDGYFSWVKSVRVQVLGKEIVLGQGLTIVVDGIQRTQYADQHKLSVYTQGQRVKLKAITGLEVIWDGIDAVEVKVPGGAANKTCGLCGNYNANPLDDWIIGPACPEKAGQSTENNDEFGQSWTVLEDSVKECDVECDRENPGPDPDPDTCLYPKTLVEKECDKLFTDPASPFLNCLSAKSASIRENIRFSCIYDLCNQEVSIDETLCKFATTISMDCSDNENEAVPAWKGQFEACKEPTVCENNMVYKICGPANPETCLTTFVDVNSTASAPGVCDEGCYCAEDMVMEGDKCIKKESCGCMYDNAYLQYGEVVYLPDCSYKVTCLGGNETKLEPIVCGAYMDCKVEDNVVGCYCQKGYVMDESGEKCVADPCHGVDCDRPHTECVDGECVCKMGFLGDCNQCEDINECETGDHNCTKLGQKCVNTPGSHGCICDEGFLPYGAGCKDVDECDYGLHSCGENSECVNTPGSHSCECCAGYKEDPQGACVRDSDSEFSGDGKCCPCRGKFCDRDGQVCGTDGNTYNNFRSLAITKCKNDNPDLAVNYPGPCVGSCDMVKCEKQYATCEPDENGNPKCGCPSCEDSSTTYSENTVCASNHITYISVCHMKKDTCEAEIETTVEVVTEGKPCPGKGDPPAGPWGEWGDCSEPCKQGVRTRTREVYGGADFHSEEEIPCYSSCENGPCTQNTCTGPAQVCVVDEQNAPSCQCPLCVVHPEEEVCGRVGAVVKTYDNQCELERDACEQGQDDYELLEPRACEDRPKECGRIRKFIVEENDNGCKAERSVDAGECYGGCDDTGDLCCYPTQWETELVILKCPDGSTRNAWVTKTKVCDCIAQDKVDALQMQVVSP